MLRAAALAVVLSGGAAHPASLLCITTNPSSRDWVPDQVLIEIDPERFEAAVLDKYTAQAMGGPVRVSFKQTAPKRLQFSWRLVGAQDRQGRKQTVNFKMTLNLVHGTFTYQGLGESFFLTPGSAQGRCGQVAGD